MTGIKQIHSAPSMAGDPVPVQGFRLPPRGLARLSVWLDRIRDLRNRKVADPGFRRWAARSVLTRRFARRQAKALFDLTAGFVYSQILSACVRVDLFDYLAKGPLDLEAIAARTGLSGESAERLLRAGAALDLVEPRGNGRYALGPLGAALVGNPGVTAMILHHDILYRDLADPLALLAGGARSELGRYWAYADDRGSGSAEPGSHADYTALMAASQAFVTSEILDAYPLGAHRHLLDIGGGDGSFLLAAGRSAPHLALSLFDLPPVAEIARRRFATSELSGRARVFAGDFFADPVPGGADLVTLNRVLHDHDDASALAILKSVRQAIAPDGTLLVAEPMAGTPGAKSSGDAYFGFYLLAMGQGRPRTSLEIAEMLGEAGFERVAQVFTNTPMIVRILSAKPVAR